MSYEPASFERPISKQIDATEELRATAWRLVAVLALALSVAVAARLALGPVPL